tara:strand:+ start:6160 stop:6501 length:342 start_codon:yes stop_codon:yes gene_type:complete
MEITKKHVDDIAILKVEGQLSIDTTSELIAEITQACQATASPTLLLDLTLLDYISSAGIQALYQCIDMVADKQGRLVLCNVLANVQKVLDMVDIQADVDIYPQQDDAIAALSS